jgi:hypothetical protein
VLGVSRPEAPRTARHSCVIVPMGTPGLRIVREMGKLIVGFVVEALDCHILDVAVHSLDLPVSLGMLGPGEAMIDVIVRDQRH